MKTYRLQALDKDNARLSDVPVALSNLDGVLVVRLQSALRPYDVEALIDTVKRLWPGRQFLLLPPDAELVRLVEEVANG